MLSVSITTEMTVMTPAIALSRVLSIATPNLLWLAGDASSDFVSGPARVEDEAAVELRQRCHARVSHHQLELPVEDLEHSLHSLLTERRQAPQVRPAYADRLCPEGERLEHISAAAEPAVDENGDAALDRLHDFREALDRGPPALLGAASVVRDDDAVGPVSHAELGVLARLDALHHQLHPRHALQPADDVPREPRGEEAADARQVQPLAHRFSADEPSQARLMTARARPGVVARKPPFGLRVPPGGKIDGEHQHRAAGRFGTLHERLRDPPRVGRIKLEPEGASMRGFHGLDR